MLGYTREEHANMMRGIADAILIMPPNMKESIDHLRMTFDFIEGLFETGHIE
jgi:hypothetical protein